MTLSRPARIVSIALGVGGLLLHLVVGMVVVVSGLVAPVWAVALLAVVWVGALFFGVRWWRRQPWLALVVPVATYSIWVLVILGGEALLGWTA